jgi:DNA-binding response OmpR family regulator
LASRILLIGTARWLTTLQRNYEVERARSGLQATAYAGQRFRLIIVDAASMYVSGERICRDMKSRFPESTLMLISTSAPADRATHADIVLCAPLTARSLAAAVTRLLAADPNDVICCGPFRLNRTARILQAHGKHVPLNPKLAGLIELFLSRPNVTLARADIMREVWKTAYLDDTRTLNVHIRHARKLLETNPQKPTFLKTVRGKGYRLEIAPEKARSRRSSPGSVLPEDTQ